MSDLTECYYISNDTARYIKQNISQRFADTWDALAEEKIPPEHIKRGLALTLADSVKCFTVTQNLGPEITEIIREIQIILEKSKQKGIHFACQSAALEILIPVILGIDYGVLNEN